MRAPTPLDKKVAAFLSSRRGDMTHRAFSKKLGIHRSTLYRIENIEQSITLTLLHKIMTRLRCSLDDIFS